MSNRIYYTALCLVCAFYLSAQVKIITRVDSLFFVGIENETLIQSAQIPLDKLSVIITGGITSGKHGKYQTTFSAVGTDAAIKVFYKKRLLAKKIMKVIRVSEPEVFVAGDTLVTGGSISKQHLRSFKSLIVKTNVLFLAMSVTGFEFKRLSNNATIDSLKNPGPFFSPVLTQILTKAIKGDTLIFDQISSTGPDDGRLIHETIKLTVTD